jgi:GNAT superfamily N-acetyltransferase
MSIPPPSVRKSQIRIISVPPDMSIVVPPGFPLRRDDTITGRGGKIVVTRQASVTRVNGTTIKSSRATAQLFPYYNEVFKIAGGKRVTVRVLTNVQDVLVCQRLPHYLAWPYGMYVGAELDGMLVGTMVLHRLPFHMRPSWRRELERKWGGYREALWIRRISVAEHAQRQGIGRALVTAAKKIGIAFWLPRPRVVELISREPDYDFLIRTGYKRAQDGRPGYLRLRASDGKIEKRRETRYYYWAAAE